MKIKHITFLDTTNNYGQILQCYALQKYLVKLGHEAELIRYRPLTHNPSRGKPLGLRNVVKTARKLVQGRLKERALAKRNASLDAKRDFESFISGCINCTELYESIDSLRRNPPVAKAYICGSDQIWGKDLMDSDSAAWFLDFGSEEIKRIAYAPSIGRDYTEEELPVFKRYLMRFQAISTREESAAQQCRDLGFDVSVVVDPTLLLDRKDYRDLASGIARSGSDYLFAYILNVKSKDEISWNEISRYVTNAGLSVRAVYSSGYYQARSLIPNVDPELLTIQEWIAAIRDARCVVTTSFHGTVFSILLHKPFIAFSLSGKKRANDRLTTLLSNLGLKNRLHTPSIPFEEQMERPVDWKEVDKRLDLLRVESGQFLKHTLEIEDNEGDMRG